MNLAGSIPFLFLESSHVTVSDNEWLVNENALILMWPLKGIRSDNHGLEICRDSYVTSTAYSVVFHHAALVRPL